MPTRYWLFKTEPEDYSIADLKRDKRTHWDGVRNYQARNSLRDDVAVGDQVIIYHSNADPAAAVGVAKVVRAGYADFTALDPDHHHFDPKSKAEAPTWMMVDVAFVRQFRRPVALAELKADPSLAGLELLRKGNRLSIQPMSKEHFERIEKLGASSA